MTAGLTPMQKTVLACVPNGEDGTTTARKVAERLYDLGVSIRGAQMVLYHLVDMGLVKVDEWGYYRP